jgi:hypothetical protein
MWRQRWLAVVLATGALTIPARAQVQLQWKLKDGDKFYLETTAATKQTMRLMGVLIEQEFETTTVDSYQVVRKVGDGIILQKKIESMKVNATGQGAEQAKQAAQKVTGALCTLTLDPCTNTITKVEGATDFFKRAFSDDPMMQQTMAATLNDDSLREDQQNVLVGFLLDKPVTKGDRWTRTSKLLLGPIGGFSSEGQFTYQGKTRLNNRDLDQIDATWSLTYIPPRNKGGLPFEITKGEFKTPTAKGTYYFDAHAGKLFQVERKYTMKGTLTLAAAGQEIEMEMEMAQTSKVRLLDKAPASE